MTSRYVVQRPPVNWWLWGAVAAAVLAAAVLGGVRLYERAQRCGDGVVERGPGDECVGVTDGSYVFDPGLAKVSRLIHAENERVEKSGDPWVSVAYSEPMTTREGGDPSERSANDRGGAVVRQAVEGAYLAQLELNHQGGRGSTPKVKLLLANSGQGAEQWEPLVDQLVDMAGERKNPLVAVAGFGQSVTTTHRAVNALRTAGVPTVGSTVAADGLARKRPKGFFRVSVPNRDQALAAAGYLAKRQAAKGSGEGAYRVDVVRDVREDDTYSTSLDRDFTGAVRKKGLRLESDGYAFESGRSASGTALASIAEKVCRPERRLDAVYFAGRGRELRMFTEALTAPGRNCPITVVSGSSALGVFFDAPDTDSEGVDSGSGGSEVTGQGDDTGGAPDFHRRWDRSDVEVLYTAYAHPEGAERIYPRRAANPYPEFARAYRGQFGGDRGLASGQAMMGHDTVITVGEAARDAAGESGREQVDAGGVLNMLLQIGSGDSVPGLSGPIAFDERGDPKDKPMALVELRPKSGERYTFRETIRP
ncbi:hypothetical protein E0L36_13500 [Streptomyces sp. AJS327]|uniref:hypothetical protein n=1 Tax=Streptomyces sp. AJS327 TaxID=2545265 RepID=UPI0015DF6853|nr:hypothetical protein [Streptomyces sp. AJS327]MBA0051875.1 hypothetical protein [Streptomyces sp. AJS327]